jgi:hypothetical protein
VQLPAGVKLPAPELEKLTVPVGVEAVPVAVSETVAVQVEDWPTAFGVWQLTDVDVERAVTVNAKPVASELAPCTESLGL